MCNGSDVSDPLAWFQFARLHLDTEQSNHSLTTHLIFSLKSHTFKARDNLVRRDKTPAGGKVRRARRGTDGVAECTLTVGIHYFAHIIAHTPLRTLFHPSPRSSRKMWTHIHTVTDFMSAADELGSELYFHLVKG